MPKKKTSPTSAKPSVDLSQSDIYQGVLLGLAVGEVLGNALAMNDKSMNQESDVELAGRFNNLSNMFWGSNTAMTLALADSFHHCQETNLHDQMQRYLDWQKQGRYSADGQAGQPPPAVHKALGVWQWKRNPMAGSHDPALIDAHPLARCAAVALYFAKRPAAAIYASAESARTSAQAPITLDACRVFTALLWAISAGQRLPALMKFAEGDAFTELRSLKLKPELLNLIDGGWRTAMTQPAGEDVLSVLSSAIHALATTTNFQSAVFKSMRDAKQPATVGAVCGALAGALYGVQGLPIIWRETLPKASELLLMSEQLRSGLI